jgi:hypothetical protein
MIEFSDKEYRTWMDFVYSLIRLTDEDDVNPGYLIDLLDKLKVTTHDA